MKHKLTKKSLNFFRKIFESKKNDIIKSITNTDINVDFDGDEIDVAQGVAINYLREHLSMRDVQTLNKLNTALEKIDEQTFGICTDCGELISEKRLEAVLGCELCVICAQQSEEQLKQYA
jgi:DnaK suppressor protein